MKNNEIKRTSRYSENRRNYLNNNGGYTYWIWDEDAKQEIAYELTSGEDGVTNEWIVLLDSWDHDEDLSERYEYEHRDLGYEKFKEKTAKGAIGDITEDEFEEISSMGDEPFNVIVEKNGKKDSEEVMKLLDAMQKLTPAQINLIYALFGELRTVTEIAEEESVTEAAIRNRRDKIKKRLEKLMAGNEK